MKFTIAAVLLSLATFVQAAAPTIGIPQPRGAQRGTDVVLVLGGNNLQDAQEVVFMSPGIAVAKLEVVNNTQVKATLKIAPDCRLGEQALRVRTATGITELRTFWVGALPVVDEKEPNNDFAAPQKIAINSTVHGVADNEDVDNFAVEAKKGQRISVEVEGMRLAGGTFFDPHVSILDSKRFELASSDDTGLYRQDGCFSVIAPEDGTYVVQVRETSYQGNGACQYRLHIGNFPRPMGVVPAGGKLGEEVEVRFVGDASGEIRQKIKLPAMMPADSRFVLHCQDAGGICPGGIPFRLSETDANVVEVEPNDTGDTGTRATLPCAFHGVIEKAGDADHFRFAAKKGQVFEVHCLARRIGSPLDSVMWMGIVGQAPFVSNDDNGGPDSIFRVTIPQDGEYFIGVTDHLKKGGTSYFYRIELRPIEARVNLGVPSFQQFTQDRQAYAVPKGNRFATLVSVGRAEFGGDLNVVAKGVHPKVAVTTDVTHSSMSQVPVVFEAAADAPISTSRVSFAGSHVDPKVAIKSGFEQRAELVYGQPNNTPYVVRTEPETLLAVTEAVPFKINLIQPKVPLAHAGSMNLRVVAERAPGFKAAITVFPLYNPPGVGSAGSVVIPEGQNEVLLPLNANGGAPVRKWKYAVTATAPVVNGPVWVSSQLIDLEISPPYLQVTLERGAVEQGKETQMFVKLTTTKPFPGNAKLRLIGLPPKVTTTELDFNKDTKEIAFPIKTEPSAPNGIHRNLFVQVVITENGEPIVHNLGNSELRIDVPIPPKKDAVVAAPMPKTAAPMPPPTAPAVPMKRLTRLEQLRLEQEEREKAAKAGTTPPAKKEEPKKN